MKIGVLDAIGYCCIALAILWLVGMVFTKPAVRAQSAGSRLFHVSLALLGGLFIGGAFARDTWMSARFVPDTHFVEWVGLALTILGCLLAAWARITLGGNWSGRATVKPGHELIVKVPYALARHPIYTGILLALAGTLLAYGQWRCVIGFAIILLALIVKMSQEERLMMQTFPQDYPDYRRRVKALIPGVF
jgi:protein-S-isoprenylcysteine O-methyltransferase Ste14